MILHKMPKLSQWPDLGRVQTRVTPGLRHARVLLNRWVPAVVVSTYELWMVRRRDGGLPVPGQTRRVSDGPAEGPPVVRPGQGVTVVGLDQLPAQVWSINQFHSAGFHQSRI